MAGLWPRLLLPVGVLSPSLSSHWVGLVIPVPGALARPLVESLRHDAVAAEHGIARYVPDPPGGLTGFDGSARLALQKVRDADIATRWSWASLPGAPSDPLPADPDWAGGSLYHDLREKPVKAPVLGRPSTPMECYLRLMFLKFRYRLGYESLCAEVSDSISWRRFCRIPLDGKVPHPTTLMKLTTRCEETAVAGLNEALLAKAAGQKLLRAARVRTDTTVIPADVAYPTDSGLLAKAAGKLTRTVRRVQAAGGATGTRMTDRRRAAARRVREIAGRLRTRGKLSREETTAVIRRVTGELADLAEKALAEAAVVLRNGRRALPRALSGQVRGRLRRALDELAVTAGRTVKIIAQTRTRLAGQTPESATRLVSLHDPDARPIRKGRIDRPVEFGYKAQVTDNDDGIVLDYGVEYGAAPDGPQLAPAVERVARRTGRVPRAVTADRGYGQPAVERDLHELGVRTVAIPRQAATSPARKAVEHGRGFRQLVKWRTGCEGRISYLKRGYGWDRTRLDGRNGAAIWCGHGVFAHNLVKISTLAS